MVLIKCKVVIIHKPHIDSSPVSLSILQLLSRLLRSKNPDDLIAANRLIKNVVKQVEQRFSTTASVSSQLLQFFRWVARPQGGVVP